MKDAYGCRFGHLENGEPEETKQKKEGSTFFLRLLLSMLLFGGFLWMYMEKRAVFGYPTEQVAETIGRNTDLQAISKSVRIEKEAR